MVDFDQIQQAAEEQKKKDIYKEHELSKRIYDASQVKKYSYGRSAMETKRQEMKTMAEDFKKKYLRNEAGMNFTGGDPNVPPEYVSLFKQFTDEINKALDSIIEYGDYDPMARRGSTIVGKMSGERTIAKKSSDALNRIDQLFQELSLFDYSDTKGFQEMYQDLHNISKEFRITQTGNLFIKADPEADGKKVHFINPPREPQKQGASQNQGASQKQGTSQNQGASQNQGNQPAPPEDLNPDTSEVETTYRKKHENNLKKLKEEGQPKLDSNGKPTKVTGAKSIWVKSSTPLFDHDPCPEDIHQAGINDCYLLATLSSIAANDPQRIKDMMTKNDDGTVTVRLYNHANEPVYVRVEDSALFIKTKFSNGEEQIDQVSAKGPKWVRLIEKAYATSGLHHHHINNDLQDDWASNRAEGGRKANFHQIDWGNPSILFQSLFGPDFTGENSREDAIHASRYNLKAPATENVGDYTLTENKYFTDLQKAFNTGSALVAGAITVKKVEGDVYEKYAGLPPNHEYAVTYFDEDPVTHKKYITVRNPHGSSGRAYDANGKPYHKHAAANGVSRVELRDFIKTFDEVAVACIVGASSVERDAQHAKMTKLVYGEALMDLCNLLDKRNTGIPSKAYKELAKAKAKFQQEMRQERNNSGRLNDAMKKLFEKAQDYIAYRDRSPKFGDRDQGETAVNRYVAAELITRLGAKYAADNDKDHPVPLPDRKTISAQDLWKEASEAVVQNQSKARAGAMKVMGERQAKVNEEKQQELGEKQALINGALQEEITAAKTLITQALDGPGDPLADPTRKANLLSGMSRLLNAEDIQKGAADMSLTQLKKRLTPEDMNRNAMRANKALASKLEKLADTPQFFDKLRNALNTDSSALQNNSGALQNNSGVTTVTDVIKEGWNTRENQIKDNIKKAEKGHRNAVKKARLQEQNDNLQKPHGFQI